MRDEMKDLQTMMISTQTASATALRALRNLFLGAALAVPALQVQAQGITLPRADIADFDVNKNAIEQAARVAGFMLAQTAVLEEIQRQHPDLAGQSAARIAAFDAKFSFPAQRARWFLSDTMGEVATDSFFENTQTQAAESAARLTRDQAQEFLSEMDLRLEGQMDEESFKAMLWLRHGRNPVDEMRDWRQRFSSAGHPKSTGLNMTLEVPLSWRKTDGNRPHVLAKWMSQNGSGAMGITLLVREYPYPVTMEEIKDIEATNDWSAIIPDDQTVLDGKVVIIDRQPAVQIDTNGQSQTLDTELGYRSRLYMAFPEGRVVNLQCMLGHAPDEDPTIVDDRFRGLQELCRRVAISMTFPDTYR